MIPTTRRRRNRQITSIRREEESPIIYGGSTDRSINPSRVRGEVIENTEVEEVIVQLPIESTGPRSTRASTVLSPDTTRTTDTTRTRGRGRGTTTSTTSIRTRGTTRTRGGGRGGSRGRDVRSTVQLPPLTDVVTDFSQYLPIGTNVEVECKFGLGRSTGFTTRVSTTILPVDQAALTETISRDYIWNQSTSRSTRSTGSRVYRKETLLFRDYSVSPTTEDIDISRQFTAKVTAASEVDVTDVSAEQVISNATLIRDKTRYSAEYRGTVLSLTYVTTTRTNTTGGNPNTTEIEVEALPGTGMDQFMAVVQEMADRLMEWQSAMNLYQLAMDPQSNRPTIYTPFRGTMPIAFRPSYSLEGYSVKHKMDGDRVNAVVLNGRVYFMTRADGLQFTDITTADTGQYVVDGEWIDAYVIEKDDSLTLLEDKHLIVFDMMYDSRVGSLLQTPYTDRYSRLEKWVNSTKLQGTELVLSPLMRPADVDIVDDTQSDGTVRSVWIRDDEVLYYTDGLILQLYDSLYVTGTDTRQYKWKEEDSITVDFRPRISGDKVELLVSTPLGEVAATTTPLDSIPTDYDLRSHIDRGTVCEFGYDKQSSRWLFHRLRTDKTSPNFITIAFDNMESAISAINTDEMLDLLHSLQT